MILYNITVIIEESIQEEWLSWVEGHHIPRVMDTEAFVSSRLLKVLDSPNEGVTYCMQFVSETLHQYDHYKTKFADALEKEHNNTFEGKCLTFSTLMEFVETR